MKPLMRKIIGLASAVLLVPFVVPAVALAADPPKPSKSVCSQDGRDKDYACMKVKAKKVPSSETVTFAGNLSKRARKNLESWTRGENIVCHSRYATKPATDGGWPSQVLEAACTTIRNNSEFTIIAELGRKGKYYYGLKMGP
ncbi:MAG: hypothetical protein OSA11_08790 [Candidatus Nanopelagicales bacterium]|nr:hypothetical protein [Candidatus Nanopelagicales bacterium]